MRRPPATAKNNDQRMMHREERSRQAEEAPTPAAGMPPCASACVGLAWGAPSSARSSSGRAARARGGSLAALRQPPSTNHWTTRQPSSSRPSFPAFRLLSHSAAAPTSCTALALGTPSSASWSAVARPFRRSRPAGDCARTRRPARAIGPSSGRRAAARGRRRAPSGQGSGAGAPRAAGVRRCVAAWGRARRQCAPPPTRGHALLVPAARAPSVLGAAPHRPDPSTKHQAPSRPGAARGRTAQPEDLSRRAHLRFGP